MEALTTGITNLMSLVNTVITEITGNTWLVIPFAAGFVALGIRVWKKLAKGSKSIS